LVRVENALTSAFDYTTGGNKQKNLFFQRRRLRGQSVADGQKTLTDGQKTLANEQKTLVDEKLANDHLTYLGFQDIPIHNKHYH